VSFRSVEASLKVAATLLGAAIEAERMHVEGDRTAHQTLHLPAQWRGIRDKTASDSSKFDVLQTSGRLTRATDIVLISTKQGEAV